MTYYMDLTPAARQRVEEQGYLIPEELRAEDVVPENRETNFLPDWDRVLALINLSDTQDEFNTIVLYNDQRLVKVRSRPSRMLNHMREHFGIDYHTDIRRTVAKALGIRWKVPFVCGDYWLLPVGKRAASNFSWFRWDYLHDKFDFSQLHSSRVMTRNGVLLEWKWGPHVFRFGLRKCKLIASYLQYRARLMCPTVDLGKFELSREVYHLVNDEVTRLNRAMILAKVGFLEFEGEVHDELKRHQYKQIPRTEF